MKQQINIAELLKDCPKGTKLYSPICGECEFDKVERVNYGGGYRVETQIKIHCNGESPLIFFKQNGCVEHGGECLLFPSKEVRDWGCFNVKYVHFTTDDENNKKLLKLLGREILTVDEDFRMNIGYIDRIYNRFCIVSINTPTYDYIFSTGTELKLKEEEEKPKFKVGDAIKVKYFAHTVYAVILKVNGEKINWKAMYRSSINFPAGDAELATLEEIAKWNEEVLQPNNLHYSKSKRKIIDWFLPFDRCVVRDHYTPWHVDLFDQYDKKECEDGRHYYCIGCKCTQCLPYNEKTAKLIGTTDDYEED